MLRASAYYYAIPTTKYLFKVKSKNLDQAEAWLLVDSDPSLLSDLAKSAIVDQLSLRYSMSSSAKASRVGGTTIPSAFAVLLLMTN